MCHMQVLPGGIYATHCFLTQMTDLVRTGDRDIRSRQVLFLVLSQFGSDSDVILQCVFLCV